LNEESFYTEFLFKNDVFKTVLKPVVTTTGGGNANGSTDGSATQKAPKDMNSTERLAFKNRDPAAFKQHLNYKRGTKMATVRLSDVQFDPDVYASYVQEDHPDMNAYVASGVAVTNALLTARAAGEGDITSIPYWKDLAYASENISGDDPSVFATPQKIGTGKMVARNVHINNAWQTANLVGEVLGSEDPMVQIQSRTSKYWENRFEARIQGYYNRCILRERSW